MTMPEFIEAVGRIADKLTNFEDYFPQIASQNKFRLDKKIESLLIIMNRNCLPKPLGENLEKQVTKSIEEELA